MFTLPLTSRPSAAALAASEGGGSAGAGAAGAAGCAARAEAVTSVRWNPPPLVELVRAAGWVFRAPLVPVAVGGAAAAGARRGRSFAITSNGSRANSNVTGCASGAIITSLMAGVKPIISTRIVHIPSARSAKRYNPCWFVEVASFLSPWLATTVAPGTATPLNVTCPMCSGAATP